MTTIRILSWKNICGYIWVIDSKLVILYDYQNTRLNFYHKKFLRNYQGFLQSDGYEG